MCVYPHKKSFEKTTLFHQYLERESPLEVQSDVLKQAFEETIGQQDLKQAFEKTIGQQNLKQASEETIGQQDLKQAFEETIGQQDLKQASEGTISQQDLKQASEGTIAQQDFPQELPQGQLEQGPSQLYPSIDEILDELAADEDIGAVLDQGLTGEDEGIGLNLEDEIFHDIQPFDFELEIE